MKRVAIFLLLIVSSIIGFDIFLIEKYGKLESISAVLIRASYDLLDLITFFTAGKTEVRAWTIKRGWKAPQAAGTIHSDFERGYIKAEVIKLTDYQKFQTELACKEAGKTNRRRTGHCSVLLRIRRSFCRTKEPGRCTKW